MPSRRYLTPLWLASCLAAGSLSSQRIVVSHNVSVSFADPNVNHNEVVLAADPQQPGLLLACAMLDLGNARTVGSIAYRSDDGGRHWALAARSDEPFAGDPSCAVGPDGMAYFATKSNTGTVRGEWASDTDSLRIRQANLRVPRASWRVSSAVQANDRPWIAIDARRQLPHGIVYAAFDGHTHDSTGRHANENFRHLLTVVSSVDGANSFPVATSVRLPMQTTDRQHSSLACGMVVLSDGTVVVLEHHLILGKGNAETGKLRELGGTLLVYRSTDGGRTLDSIASFGELRSSYNNINSRSITGSVAVDPGSKTWADRIYAVWGDAATGRGIIRLSHSSDAGVTWSLPASLGEDRTIGAANDAPDNFMPTVAVNRDGVVGVLWYDRRDHKDNIAYDAWFSASVDGGATWLPSVRVSSAPNDPAQRRSGADTVHGRFLTTGGDTAGLAADADGRFHAAWIDNRRGVQQVWTAAIEIRPAYQK